MITARQPGLAFLLCLALVLLPGLTFARDESEDPEPDSLAELTARVCGLVQPSAELAAAAAALPATPERGEQMESRERMARRLAALAREVDGVCRLYTTEGERLFLGQEISSIYRRRRAVERCLARGPLPVGLEPGWSELQPALVRLHQAVDWRAFNAWYLERDGDSD